MELYSVSYLRKEIQAMPHNELIEVCNKLIKYKKENKELVQYLLFESSNETGYIENLKSEVDRMFSEVNTKNIFFAKKTIRKIVRHINRYCKYSGQAITYIELLIHFCEKMKALPLRWKDSKVMINLYDSQLKKIDKYIQTLHEDLQYDYQERIEFIKN